MPTDHPNITRSTNAKEVSKSWGYEIWIANSELYCGKLLRIRPHRSTSQHFHILKTEHIYVDEGQLLLTLWEDAKETHHTLRPGDSILITPGLVHRLQAGWEGVTLYEFSTQHWDSDSYRISR